MGLGSWKRKIFGLWGERCCGKQTCDMKGGEGQDGDIDSFMDRSLLDVGIDVGYTTFTPQQRSKLSVHTML